MFRGAGQVVRKAQEATGKITTLAVPYKGLNARSPFSATGPEFAISLRNAIPESFGLRTRKGYTEWAREIPGGSVPVNSILSYFPAVAAVSTSAPMQKEDLSTLMFNTRVSRAGTPPGQLFAAKGDLIYNVTAGGVGPWVPEVGVSGAGSYWNGVNFQNIAGAFLCVCNEQGGYAIYGTATGWEMPIQGTLPGQINGVNPATLCLVTIWKRRLWFIQLGTTKAWYLPVDSITGDATEFDFGSLFPHGGTLAYLANWTVEGGAGIDDNLVAISSQGDVAIYKGTDPDTADTFSQIGVWYVGPLPVGRRQVLSTGGEVYILSQFGVMPVSRLLQTTSLAAEDQQHLSFNVDPIVARLMQDYSTFQGWQIVDLAKEELLVIGIPKEATQFGGMYLAYKATTQGWAFLTDTTYASLVNIGALIYAGTTDGRVVRAFDGPLDNVLLSANLIGSFSNAFSSAFGGGYGLSSTGLGIACQVTPAYQPMGDPGYVKRFTMVRPSFTARVVPTLTLQILTDYGAPAPPVSPTLPIDTQAKWDVALWDVGKWTGILPPIRNWLGCSGYGFSATVQLDYVTGGDTLLTAIDFWSEQGGVM